jgi:hypothetical protein
VSAPERLRRKGEEIYAPELELLSELTNKRRLYTAGFQAAALVTVALDPRALDVWARYSNGLWTHDRSGFDAAGYLLNQVEQATEIDFLTRTPVYQHYLFQIALAIVLQWLDDQDQGIESRFKRLPPAPPVADLIERVRESKGYAITPKGFRPVKELHDRIPVIGPLKIFHPLDEAMVLTMAIRAAKAEGLALTLPELSETLKHLIQARVPADLAHPGALAAAVVDCTVHPETKDQWMDLWSGYWDRTEDGEKWSGRMFRMIRNINRRQLKREHAKTKRDRSALAMTIDLYRSCRDAARVGRQDRALHLRWTALPQASDVRDGPLAKELATRWADLGIPKAPKLSFLTFAPLGAPPLQSPQKEAAERHMGDRQETGRLAEEYFMARHASIDPAFQGQCIDMRTKGQGHDFQIVSDTGRPLLCETKGLAGETGGIEMTLPELTMARTMGDDYYLVIIRNLAGTPFEQVIQNPAAHLKMTRRETRKKEVRIQVSDKSIREALERCKGKKGKAGSQQSKKKKAA